MCSKKIIMIIIMVYDYDWYYDDYFVPVCATQLALPFAQVEMFYGVVHHRLYMITGDSPQTAEERQNLTAC